MRTLSKKRLDTLVLERKAVESRAKAQALIMSGRVTVNENVVTKPGIMVPGDARIRLLEPPPYVGRGGVKLQHALEQFRIDVRDKVALDIGASTGGFTDCLIKHGIKRVYAVDVGYGQLDYRLRKDARVVVMEGINARYPLNLPEKVDLVTIDVSFISLKKVIPSALSVINDDGRLIVLFKPQFEAERREVGKGGIIKDPVLHATLLGRFIKWVTENNIRLKGLISSPILGAEGNREFLLLLSLT